MGIGAYEKLRSRGQIDDSTRLADRDLDDSAVRPMRTWRFEARTDGTAVAAQIEVSMSFYVK